MAKEDDDYANWIRSLPCCSCGVASQYPYNTNIAIHHKTGAGMGLRAHDWEGMPMCHSCHDDFHAARGRFKSWGHAKRKKWQEDQVRRLRSTYRDAF